MTDNGSDYCSPSQFAALPLTEAKRYVHGKRILFPERMYEVEYTLLRGRSLRAAVYAPGARSAIEYRLATSGDKTGNAIVTATRKVIDDIVASQKMIRLTPAR